MSSQIYFDMLTPTFPAQLNTPANPARCHGLICVTGAPEGGEGLTRNKNALLKVDSQKTEKPHRGLSRPSVPDRII